MQAITTIGLDIAKSGFHVHGVDAEGMAEAQRRFAANRRKPSKIRDVKLERSFSPNRLGVELGQQLLECRPSCFVGGRHGGRIQVANA
jgi:transposase